MTLTEMCAAAEARDGQIMDRHNTDKIRRERDRYRAKVEVLELEVAQLRHELEMVVNGYRMPR